MHIGRRSRNMAFAHVNTQGKGSQSSWGCAHAWICTVHCAYHRRVEECARLCYCFEPGNLPQEWSGLLVFIAYDTRLRASGTSDRAKRGVAEML